MRALWRCGPVIIEWSYAVALLALTVASRYAIGDGFLVWMAATYLPYWFAPAFLLIAWGLVRRRLLRHLPSLALCLCFLWLWGAQLLPAHRPGQQDGFTVMTYNVKLPKAGTEVDSALAGILAARPEVLALQEVTDTEPDDLVERLRGSGYVCEHRPYLEEKTAGVAVCVREPVSLVQAQRRTYHERGEWSYLFAETRWSEQTVNLVIPHLLSYRLRPLRSLAEALPMLRRLRRAKAWHRQEATALLELVEGFRDPTVMAGDFNSTPQHRLHARIRRHMQDAFRQTGWGFGGTFRFVLPLRIDYVYVGRELEVLSARVGARGPSDHRPVIARVRLRAGS